MRRPTAMAPDLAAAGATPRLAAALTALAIAWCAAFLVLGLGLQLQTFADGALFSYAVAAGDSWAMHWRNISGRVFAWLWSYPGPEAYARLTSDAAGAVALHGALFFAAPALGLAATFAADRGAGRIVTLWACASTALVLPVVFGFPTELWIAHSAFWPALALLLAPGGRARFAATLAATAALTLSHEGGAVWAVAAGLAAAVAGGRGAAIRAVTALGGAFALWAAMKASAQTDPYVSEALARNAVNFLDPRALLAPLPLTLAAALCLYAAAAAALSRAGFRLPIVGAAALAGVALGLWWLLGDGPLHAWDRYYLRTALFGATPLLGFAAAAQAAGWPSGSSRLSLALRAARAPLLGAIAVVTLVHAGELARFGAGWRDYTARLAALSMGEAADPDLGHPDFVSAARLGPAQQTLGWFSTTPFLSALSAPGMAPRRLATDPAPRYWWFGCATATAHADRPGAIPPRTRSLIRDYACRGR